MNKLKTMKKQITKIGGIAAAMVVVTGGVMVFTSSMASSAAQRKTDAENARNNDSSQVSSMNQQIAQSGDAAKRYLEIQLKHPNPDFSANTDVLKEWLRETKDRYRFSNDFKLTLALDKPSDKPEFANMNFDVEVRSPMKLDFGAISDMHVYSFVEQLLLEQTGFVRITRLELKRRTDMDATSYRQFLSGLNPDYVSASLEFEWVGVKPKPTAAQPDAPPPAEGM